MSRVLKRVKEWGSCFVCGKRDLLYRDRCSECIYS